MKNIFERLGVKCSAIKPFKRYLKKKKKKHKREKDKKIEM